MTASLSVRVPASTSNLGAGFDCLGLALDLWLVASLVEGSGPPLYSGTLAGIDPRQDLVARTLNGIVLNGKHLEIRSDIPVGKGLGSSAAAHVAGAALRQLVTGGTLDADAAFEHAASAEGHPDNAAPAAYGGLVLAAEKPRRLPLHASMAVALAVPDTGMNTQEARAILPRQVPRGTAIAQAARAAALVQGLLTGDRELVGFGMEDQLAVPHRKGLIPGYDAAVNAGLAAGAYGVTISGAGSSLLALTDTAGAPTVAKAMAEALTAAGNQATPLTPAVAAKGLT